MHVHLALKRFIGALEIVQKQPIATPLPQALDPAMPRRQRTKSNSSAGGRRESIGGGRHEGSAPKGRDGKGGGGRKRAGVAGGVGGLGAGKWVQTASKVLYGVGAGGGGESAEAGRAGGGGTFGVSEGGR